MMLRRRRGLDLADKAVALISLFAAWRCYSRVAPPPPAPASVIRVSRNNIAYRGPPKEGPKPRQLLALPPFPAAYASIPLPGRKDTLPAQGQEQPGRPGRRVTAITWVKHYFADVDPTVIQSHFNKGLVQVGCSGHGASNVGKQQSIVNMRKIKHNEAMEPGMQIYVPVSVAETKVAKRYDTIPTATLHPNADEIKYLQRLVTYKDSSIIVLNKPPKVPVKGNLPVHNSMDVLAAAALSYGNEEGPKLVHRLDVESSGLLLMGRTKESTAWLHWLFSSISLAKSSSEVWNSACEATVQRYWALVIGCPKEKEGLICAPLSKLRVNCAEALGTPIVGDFKYGWYVHRRWKQMPNSDYEPVTGEPYRLLRPEGLAVQKGSVLSKVPLLHLHCCEMVIPNVAKFITRLDNTCHDKHCLASKSDLQFVAPMPSHIQISWNIMSFLV